MLEIALSTSDVMHVRFAVSPVHQLEASVYSPRKGGITELGDHRRAFASAGARADPIRSLVRLRSHDLPEAFTPGPISADPLPTLESQLDAVLSLDSVLVARSVERFAQDRRADHFVRALASGSPWARGRMVDALRDFHRAAFGDRWNAIYARLLAEVEARANQLAYMGLGSVLASLSPMVSWADGVLRLSKANDTSVRRIVVAGRGLVLVPTVGRRHFFGITDSLTGPVVFSYPVPVTGPVHGGYTVDEVHSRHLSGVIGHTRARVLFALGSANQPLNTSELAKRCSISPASASEHATALRQAGLVRSHRDANMVLHSLTVLGRRLTIA